MKPLHKKLRSCIAAIGCLLSMQLASAAVLPPEQGIAAPAFTHTVAQDWLNTAAPLDWAQLRGKVVLLEFWAFECWNCSNSIAWLSGIHKTMQAQGLEVVAVHTPELEIEHSRTELLKHIAKRRIAYPVMIDNDYSYWKALANRYWPAFYLVDRQGRLRAAFAGETHVGDANARQIESAIRQLLAEDGPAE